MRKKKVRPMNETMSGLVDQQAREQMLRAVLDKATAGDMRAIEFVREVLGETWKTEQEPIRIELGKGVEELCR